MPLDPNHHLDTPVDCAGYVVFTERFASDGRLTGCQHSAIKRRYADAQAVLGKYGQETPGELVRQTIQVVRTCWPLRDVLAGNAERWGDAELTDLAA